MKKIFTFILSLSIILITAQCSKDNDIKAITTKSKEVVLQFNDNGIKQTVKAMMVYNLSLKRSQLISDEIIELVTKDKNGKTIYAYTLKTNVIFSANGRVEKFQIKRGYYGYDSGCYYWGTLYIDDDGDELFVQDRSNFNAPVCEPGIWA